ncbi:UDP-GlcNAc:polypeptide N-acetylglucosaminyltransferase [Trypanosoma rangeli]|uniref:UDP-GlcNAc:polypeptide N-acetylglucosaminyltransferase n=1 Tax=Trypanosoma rangeli TaxID=5698 RepID=A0A3R7MSE0_TRYRA|nr:UDP-GlcNAc:polypeptide N-acetylglucosaminyltransferase [Trypanosoma rangeli]RNF07357.1 UDP-GlcNAc:polypeptide N-acetylglucosaminyltransferase [Trypanosoma rangeli]|eukprot:RNF07357.1 UDP-GlcNAc:polypeptide N-acetylglucosaminyltransferase [Trypanosoma rangeli]
MQFGEPNVSRQHNSQRQRCVKTTEAERYDGRPHRTDAKPARTLWQAVGACLSSDAHVIKFLLVIIFILIVMCLGLIGLSAWMLLHRTNNAPVLESSRKFFDNNAIMDVWRLYDAAQRSDDEYHKTALREYLIRYKNQVEQRREAWNLQHKVTEIDVKDVTGGEGPILPRYTPSPTMRLPSLMASLRTIINRIESQDPEKGLERAGAFVEEQMKEAVAAGSHTGEMIEEGEAVEPLDDILYLQLRRLHESAKHDAAAPTTPHSTWWENVKATAPSVYTKRFYYPLRRFHRMRRFSAETQAVTAAWFDALVDDYYGENVTHFSPPTLPTGFAALMSQAVADSEATSAPLASPAHTGSLFVNIASFRDKECWPTVDHMIRRSTNMFRVYWGIAQQNYYTDLPCVSEDALEPQPCLAAPITPGLVLSDANYDGAVCFPADNIRVRHINSHSAFGPTYGRYMAMLLYRGEDYTLVLDSHNRFVYAWDTRIVAMQLALQHPKAVLSHYPESYDETKGTEFKWERTTTAYLCQAKFLESAGYLRLIGILIDDASSFKRNARHVRPYYLPQLNLDPNVVRPLPQPWAAGGFIFANASIMREVPFDLHLPHIFDGEEVMYSVRLWTHGYDIYSPKRGICYHFYGRPKEPKLWNEAHRWYTVQAHSRRRIQYLLRARVKGVDVLRVPKNTQDPVVMVDADRYGTGRLRSVEEWYKFAGADPVQYVLDGRWCG